MACFNVNTKEYKALEDKYKDKMIVDIQEAYHIEKVKTQFFDRLRMMVQNRVAK